MGDFTREEREMNKVNAINTIHTYFNSIIDSLSEFCKTAKFKNDGYLYEKDLKIYENIVKNDTKRIRVFGVKNEYNSIIFRLDIFFREI
jgi:hypothetical protein